MCVYPWILILAAKIKFIELRFTGSDKSKFFQNPLILFFFISCGVALRASIDFYLVDPAELILPVSVVTMFLSLLIYLFSMPTGRSFFKFLGSIFIAMFYAYGSVIIANCLLDGSSAQIFQAQIKDKFTTSSKYTHRYLKLMPWGPVNLESNVDVPKSFYERVKIGEALEMELKPGKLGIAWYAMISR